MLERFSIGAVFDWRPADFFIGRFYGVVEANKSAAPFHLSFELGKMREGWVVAAAIGIDEDSVGVVYQRFVGPLPIEADLYVDLVGSAFPQAFGKQLDTCVVFVLAGTVARAPGNEKDVAFCVCSVGGTC